MARLIPVRRAFLCAKQNCAARPTDCPPDQCLHSVEADVRPPRKKSGFDPEQSSAAVFGNKVDIDQHLTKCIVGTVKVMLAVCSLEICCSKVSQLSSLIIIWRRQMSRLVSVALIAAAMFASPAMAAWHDKNGAVIPGSSVMHCVRAPDTGQFAGGAWNRPPCEPATRVGAAWHDKNGTVIPASSVMHCIRAPDTGQFAGGAWNRPPCEPATWR
jgi:hypothetical protein